jgi:hypothetical protein
VSAGGTDMSSLPIWAEWPIAAAAVLLGPVFGFLMAIGVEMLIGIFKEASGLALLSAPAIGLIGWTVFRKLCVRPRGSAPVGARA